jgi:hypothetical protein
MEGEIAYTDLVPGQTYTINMRNPDIAARLPELPYRGKYVTYDAGEFVVFKDITTNDGTPPEEEGFLPEDWIFTDPASPALPRVAGPGFRAARALRKGRGRTRKSKRRGRKTRRARK